MGFRPAIWRIANELGVRGRVSNDAEGVLIEAWGNSVLLDRLVERIRTEAPSLARIESVQRQSAAAVGAPADFRIVSSGEGTHRPALAADAATCPQCLEEVLDPFARRFRYPFTNCTQCGPRFSVVRRMPYDRPNTTMAHFAMCAQCAAEYASPADRRFHAQPIACHACGPRLSLVRSDGRALAPDALAFPDEADATCSLLQQGRIVAIQGLGGYQLACDATQDAAVARLRAGKERARKPLALLARDLEVVRRYCNVSAQEAQQLRSAAAPIVLLQRASASGNRPLSGHVAPGVQTLGFMLPNTPLHHLVMRRMDRPVVLTSGNLADEPQAICREDAAQRLGGIARYRLEHDRPIARRIDDSVVRVMAGKARLLRRARGFAPEPLALPAGFERAPAVLAYGGDLKNTFCLAREGQATLSAHIGDLQDALTRADFEQQLEDLQSFLRLRPALLACDLHPDYAATRIAEQASAAHGLPLQRVQHHHAHLAACLAENGVALDGPAVLGIVLDGLGMGADGGFWGGEFLLGDYAHCTRLATFRPVALPGGDVAAREPWRNTWAHLIAGPGWQWFESRCRGLELYDFLRRRPLAVLNGMLERGINSPPASSCGRLCEAVAAAVGIARERAVYEGQGAIELEAAIDTEAFLHANASDEYPFDVGELPSQKVPCLEPRPMWKALLRDLAANTPVGIMAARFHRGLAAAILRMARRLLDQLQAPRGAVRQVALSGGVFQNRALLELISTGLEQQGVTVLTHSLVPCSDGGLALGQAAVTAARALRHGS